MKKLIALALLASLVGCTSPTGIVPVGSGLYMSSKLGGMGTYSGGQVKAGLVREASAFCAKSGKEVQLVNSKSLDSVTYNYASAEIQFKCE